MSDKVTMIITIVISFIAILINFNTFSRLESPSWPQAACVQPDLGPDFHVHAVVPVHYEEF
jgi:hypothetical protein